MQLNENIAAVVSGGASGMGEATVRALREKKVRVAILDRNGERGNLIAKETGAFYVEVDVTNEDSVVRAFEKARQEIGQERILVHTPGGGARGITAWRNPDSGKIERHSFANFEQSVKLNLCGSFLCASVAAAGMMENAPEEDGDRGVIIMTSSTASQDGPGGLTAYVASKSGINGMTLSMARDLAPEGIRVNTILPGTFDTPLNAPSTQAFKDTLLSWTLHPKRFGHASEYATLALELIRNPYINAATFRIDGGARI